MCLSIGGRFELAVGKLQGFDSACGYLRPKSDAARSRIKRWGGEGSADDELGSKELFDGPDTFRDKESLSLAGFTSLKVASEC